MKNDFIETFWIGLPGDGGDLGGALIETAYFGLGFTAPAGSRLVVKLSASTRYKLWVNGRFISHGPCKGSPFSQYYDEFDLSDYLLEGSNFIAATVMAYPPFEANTDIEHGPQWAMVKVAGACLMLEGACLDSSGALVCDLSTGVAPWLVSPDLALSWKVDMMSAWIGSMENVDAAKLPPGWPHRADPSVSWLAPKTKWRAGGYPFGALPVFPLKERPIPQLYMREKTFTSEMPLKAGSFKELRFDDTLLPNSSYAVELNAGELTTGYFRLPLSGGAGSKITIRYAECYALENPGKIYYKKGIRDDSKNYEILGHEDIYFPSGRDETYEPFWFRTFRFIRIEIKTGSEGVVLHPPSYVETGYPLETRSSLSSNEDWVAKIWEISERTLQRCMHETYEDCPYYEQLQYAMDTRLQMLYTYMISGDTRLARRAIEDYHSSMMPEGILQARYPCNQPQVITCFSLYWICMLEDYYQQTGDLSVPRRYRPTIDSVLDWYDRNIGELGLVENSGYWELADWVQEWSHLEGAPEAGLHGPSSIHNLLYAYGLQAASRLTALTGRAETASEYQNRADEILQLVEKTCWSEENGMYAEGPSVMQFSQHAQIWAVLSGLATGEKAKRIMTNAINAPGVLKCSFAMQFYLFRALEAAGMYEATESLWYLWKDLLPLKLTTVIEAHAMPRSDCHAWGALPIYEFTKKFLGVNPQSPGWESILIEPKCTYINEIKGEVTTPKGPVNLEITNTNNKQTIKGKSPKGIPLKIKLPNGKEKTYPDGGSFELSE